ncbi:protein kinase domain-containing protein [Streptomyces sp. NBC_01187]|uniref:serine/threonine-protein kinase n=1 Tax=Streptomyces sp. NBC_01187 TaxID=2903766 RepID=UPI003866B893
MEPLAAGDPVRVGGFVLRGRLGAGGMGEVFLGRSPGGKAVAVKVVHPHLARQAEFRRRFRREVAAAQAVSGAFTAPVVAAGPEDEAPWIATVYIPGPTLTDAVTGGGPLPEGAVWPLAAGLVEALQAIHAKDLLHRDLKPSNVLLAADGPRVIDFGIARAMDATVLTGTGTAIGTPGFMSPEQAEGGQVGSASDVFALGAVIAFAATGHEPFGQGPPLAVLHRVVNGEPRLDGLTDPLHALVAACLAKNHADRPTTVQLLGQIAAHWDSPNDFPPTPPWPQAVTALIQTRAIPATAPYTQHTTTPPSTPTTSTTAAAAREDLDRRHSDAWELGQAGEYAEAARLFAELAADQARVLGPAHPDTLDTRSRHGGSLENAGEYAEAARLFAELAADRARVLGPDHYITLLSRHHHAWGLGEAGEHGESARLYAELASDSARVLGPDHPDTLNARAVGAGNLGKAGEHAEAARLHAELVADRTRVLGPDHYITLLSRHHHAWELGEAGEHAESARLYAELASDSARVLGPDHPDTLNARAVGAGNLGKAGEHAEAARLLAEVAADRARVFMSSPRDWAE